jgi:hypothetical protein
MLRAVAIVACLVSTAGAGTLIGRIEIPALPERPPPEVRGFLERIDNPLAPARNVDASKRLVIVLEGDEKAASPPNVTWELVGESFVHPVIAAAAGAEITIKNTRRVSRTLAVIDAATNKDTKLVDVAPINPTGTKTFRVAEAGKVYTVVDPQAPYFRGTIVVVNTPFVAYPDDSGKFDVEGIPDGTYKVRVYASVPASAVAGGRDGWLAIESSETVRVVARGKTTIDIKLPASAFQPAKK